MAESPSSNYQIHFFALYELGFQQSVGNTKFFSFHSQFSGSTLRPMASNTLWVKVPSAIVTYHFKIGIAFGNGLYLALFSYIDAVLMDYFIPESQQFRLTGFK